MSFVDRHTLSYQRFPQAGNILSFVAQIPDKG